VLESAGRRRPDEELASTAIRDIPGEVADPAWPAPELVDRCGRLTSHAARTATTDSASICVVCATWKPCGKWTAGRSLGRPQRLPGPWLPAGRHARPGPVEDRLTTTWKAGGRGICPGRHAYPQPVKTGDGHFVQMRDAFGDLCDIFLSIGSRGALTANPALAAARSKGDGATGSGRSAAGLHPEWLDSGARSPGPPSLWLCDRQYSDARPFLPPSGPPPVLTITPPDTGPRARSPYPARPHGQGARPWPAFPALVALSCGA